jgi:uncharacterized integral membrane protein (TIGR00698 family)
MLLLAFVAGKISHLFAVDGKYVLDKAVIVIILSLLAANIVEPPRIFQRGIREFERILKTGIVLLGLGLSFSRVLQLGSTAIIVVLVCITAAPLLIYFIGRKVGLPEKLNVLIGVGTTICGGTAIAVTAPVIDADEDDVSYAIGTIALFGLMAMFVYPVVGHLISLSQTAFGVWAGTAIHSTPQVVGAGFIYGDIAGETATVTKLTRNLFMLPAVVGVGIWWAGKELRTAHDSKARINYLKIFPLFLFGFLGLAIVRTLVDGYQPVPPDLWAGVTSGVNQIAKFLIIMGLAGIGLNARFRGMRRIGYKPFVLGLVASVIIAILSISLIGLLNIG